MDCESPPKRLSLTLPKNKSKCFEILPVWEPTTPTSWVTPIEEEDFLNSSFDSHTFEEHKYIDGCRKEMRVEDLLRKTIPRSLVSQKTPSLNFSLSSCGSDNDSNCSKEFPTIKIIKKK